MADEAYMYENWLRSMSSLLAEPMYRLDWTYEQNKSTGPMPAETRFQCVLNQAGSWQSLPQSDTIHFLGFDLHSELGVAAGPLLDSAWIKRCADLGFGMLSYKTVRTREYPAHPLPNIVYLDAPRRLEPKRVLEYLVVSPNASSRRDVTITNSFGMPSLKPEGPEGWMNDVEIARSYLSPGQILVVSVVGTPPPGQENAPLEILANDYAACAAMAMEAGADIVEANLSCPNVTSKEGSLYDDPDAAETVARAIRRQIPDAPLGLKLGYFSNLQHLRDVVLRVASLVNILVSINSVKLTVKKPSDEPALGIERTESGVCGYAIRDLGLYNVQEICRIRKEHNLSLKVVGCGGCFIAEDIEEYLSIGADAVEVATGAIWRPSLGMEWKAHKVTRGIEHMI